MSFDQWWFDERFFPELTLQVQHHQQEYPCEFDDYASTKDDKYYANANNEPKNESLFGTQPLIDNAETVTNKDVALDHDATQIIDDEDNDNNNNDDDDEDVSTIIVA